MNNKFSHIQLICITLLMLFPQLAIGQNGLTSIELGQTISNVRIATNANGEYIVANSYEGTLMGIDYNGTTLWTNALSGYMNHDVWCDDITGDGIDEILAANADGNIYCLDKTGTLLWQFMQDEVPMFSVCAIKHNTTHYVVASSLDLSIYYISATGNFVKEIPSSTYSEETTWGDDAPPSKRHLANFVRTIKTSNGAEDLLVHGCVNTNSTNGSLYFFTAFADMPHTIENPQNEKPVGDVRVSDYFGNGQEKIMLGSSTIHNTMDMSIYTQNTQQMDYAKLSDYKGPLGGFGYRVVQSDIIPKGNSYEYFTLIGPNITLIPPSLDLSTMEILNGKYSFNDMWHDKANSKMILASVQSGGSCIHVIDYTNSGWKNAYRNITPPGNIQKILDNTQAVRNQLNTFSAPNWERQPKPVHFVSDLVTRTWQNSTYLTNLANDIHTNYSSPILLGNHFMSNAQDPQDWNRDTMSNVVYRNKRDGRKNYNLTQQQIEDEILPNYSNFKGLAYWGGHGNDPYFFSFKTTKALLDGANGKKTVLIYPELQDDSQNFRYAMDNLFYPLATYARTHNTQIHVRTKHTFWQGAAYGPNWDRLYSGEFADIFVPTMEQTGDKSMDLSIAARMGFWMGGSVNEWGDRAVPDNASYYRLRQHSDQKLPNHHLREVIYAAANGATHFNNFRVDVEYTSLVWELIAKGALYVPNQNEILSISPVHVSMTTDPDPYYLNEGANTKWLTFYDKATVDNNKLVFGRLNGSWPGAPVTAWDFSRYAANEKERRLNHIPRYNNGLVLITPVQDGPLALQNQPRGRLTDHLHPFYKNITKEYITDGRKYYSSDGTQTYPAETFYTTIKNDIKYNAGLLPLTVSGDVGWVVAQTDSLHLRLTIVDGGWLNPGDKQVTVTFHSSSPVAMTDVLDGEIFDLSDLSSVKVDIPCGMFRFIDITLDHALPIENGKESVAFNLFPNPASDLLNVAFTAADTQANFHLVDMKGRVLEQKTMNTRPSSEHSVQFDVSGLASGSYMIRWVEGGVSQRFVR